jgi:Domain of unknown function (DUF4351)
MTQFPHDEFAKNFLDSLLSPLGTVEISQQISSEVRYADVYFTPQPNVAQTEELGLLAKLATNPVVFEPFRNSVKIPQIRACMSKLFDLQQALIKEAKKEKQSELAEDSFPLLWILTPTLSAPILEGFGAKLDLEQWGEGVYLMPAHFKTGIIVIHQLPKTPATLWLRILGKGRVQEQAIKEVAALPVAHPQRDNVLELLGNLKVILEARVTIEPEERELIMQLSPLYLEKIQAAELVGEQRGEIRGEQRGEIRGEQRGEVKEPQTLILRLLKRRVGDVSELEARIKQLPLAQLEELGESLLDFSQMSDLVAWLDSAIDI